MKSSIDTIPIALLLISVTLAALNPPPAECAAALPLAGQEGTRDNPEPATRDKRGTASSASPPGLSQVPIIQAIAPPGSPANEWGTFLSPARPCEAHAACRGFSRCRRVSRRARRFAHAATRNSKRSL